MFSRFASGGELCYGVLIRSRGPLLRRALAPGCRNEIAEEIVDEVTGVELSIKSWRILRGSHSEIFGEVAGGEHLCFNAW